MITFRSQHLPLLAFRAVDKLVEVFTLIKVIFF
jgi:hypothetical protein